MSVSDLIREFEKEGIKLWEEAGTLHYRAPKGVLTESRRSGLREKKQAIIDYLRSRPAEMQIQPQPATDEPFPLTEIQTAYLLGRRDSFAYGGVGCHGYGELVFAQIDLSRLTKAWRTLIRRHDMLRAVVHEVGTQQILRDVPEYEIAVLDLSSASAEEATAKLEQVRAKMDHRVYEPGVWPLFDLRITQQRDHTILHFSIDLLIADFVSTQLLLDEFHKLIVEPDAELPPVELSFRDYVMATETRTKGEKYTRDREYWLKLLDSLPPAPELPILESSSSGPPRFKRHQLVLAPEKWSTLSANASAFEVTPSTAVLAVFAETIARWSRRPHFCLNLTLQSRLPLHSHVERLVGDFTSLELLEVNAEPVRSFRERARALQLRLWEDLDHRSFTGSEVMRELSRRDPEHGGLFPVVFTSALQGGQRGPLSGLSDLTHAITQTPQVWIDCQVIESRQGLIINWDTRQGIFPPGLIDEMFAAFENLLNCVGSTAEVWYELDPVKLPPAQLERRRVINNNDSTPLSQTLLHEGVVAQARRNPDRTAVITSDGALTFGELLKKATTVAGTLRKNGALTGDLVAVALEKGCDQPVAVLGILLAGCAYVPLDNDQPAARRNQVLLDAGVNLALVQSVKENDADWPESVRRLPMGDLQPCLMPDSVGERVVNCKEPAYVIYTSGSTGTPKGVVVSHQSALNTIADINRRFQIGPSTRILGLSNLGFDLSVYDIFGVLAAGGCLVLPDDCRRADPSHWTQLIADHEVTLWNSVPALMQMLHDYLIGESEQQARLGSLRLALLSGDWIPVRLPEQIRKLLPNLSLVSLGGATEAAIWSIYHPIETVLPEWRSIPYGKPLANQSFHVLDQALRPCPDWVPGELYIGGAGLALGYWRDERRTAERFIQHPETGERLYRTGDWGRYLSDGSIEFLGREDRQVKIRGYRIELAEIETAVGSHAAVGRAAVVVSGDQSWEKRLVAYLEPGFLAANDGPAADYSSLQEVARTASADFVPETPYAAYMKTSNEAALLSMLFALSEWGIFNASPETLEQTLSPLAPHYKRLVHRWMRALNDTGLLTYVPQLDRYAATREINGSLVDEAWRRVEESGKELESQRLIGFFRNAALRLPEFLRSESNVSQIIAPSDQLSFLQAIYNDALLSRWARRVATAVLKEIVSASGGELKVLELGAVSSLTGCMPRVEGNLKALITDPSAWLLEQMRRQLGEREDLSFAVFDINRPYWAQGMESNSFDVIISFNTLHRAANIDVALNCVAELLKPSGWLILVEATGDHYPIMMSLELMLNPDPMTGDFLDQRRGRRQTFLTGDEWQAALRRAGGEPVVYTPGGADQNGHSGMQVLASHFKSNRERIDTREVESFLAKRLPAYMIPCKFQVLDALPRTANAKTDYQLLRTWAAHRVHPTLTPAEVAGSDLERRLSQVWSEMLNTRGVGRDQTLLSLGGDSLIAARLAGRLRETVPEAGKLFFDEILQRILKGATIADLAATLTEAPGEMAQVEVTENGGAAVVIRGLGGSGETTLVVVPDDLANLTALQDFTDLLAAHGTVVGIAVDDAEAFLNLDHKRLIRNVASASVDALIDDANLSLEVIGFGKGSTLALELASQMTEAGGIVHNVLIVDSLPSPRNQTSIDASLPDSVYSHLLRAAETWEGTAYTGDVTILRSRTIRDADDEAVQRWARHCLRDLRVVEVEQNDSSGVVEAILDAHSNSRAEALIQKTSAAGKRIAGIKL